MSREITGGYCPHIKDRQQQTLNCENCKYNHVENVVLFVAAAKTYNPTRGTVCCYEERRRSYGKK